jgi:hypothetical protein
MQNHGCFIISWQFSNLGSDGDADNGQWILAFYRKETPPSVRIIVIALHPPTSCVGAPHTPLYCYRVLAAGGSRWISPQLKGCSWRCMKWDCTGFRVWQRNCRRSTWSVWARVLWSQGIYVLTGGCRWLRGGVVWRHLCTLACPKNNTRNVFTRN